MRSILAAESCMTLIHEKSQATLYMQKRVLRFLLYSGMLTGRVGGKPQNNPSIDEVSVKGLAYVLENKCKDFKFRKNTGINKMNKK